MPTVLTLTPTLGRQSTRYPNGRPYQTVWNEPYVVYPRPIPERTGDVSIFKLGAHTEFDKWPADTVWNPCIGVKDGAFPYKVTIANETVDGVSASTGVQTAAYIEDDTATSPYLRLRHPGFTAPSGGTKVIAFTVNIQTPAGETTSVDVSLTVYARDHASFTTHFCVFDTDGLAANNGTGTFASPKTVLSGTPVNGNNTVVGSNWNSSADATSKTRLLLVIGNGVMKMAPGMLNYSTVDASHPNGWFPGQQGPRQIIALEGHSPIYEIEAGVSGSILSAFWRDVTIRGFTIRCAAGTTVNFCYSSHNWERCSVYDVTFKDVHIVNSSANGACIKSANDAGSNHFVANIVGDNIFTDEVNDNLSGLFCLFNKSDGLFDNCVMLPSTGGTQKQSYTFRFKHSSTDVEVRRCVDLNYTSNVSKVGWDYSTGGSPDDHIRAVFRYGVVMNDETAFRIMAYNTTGNSTDEVHSVMVHFNTFKGSMVVDRATDTDAGVPNQRQFHAYGNLIENANYATNSGWGSMDADLIPATGKSAMIENSISGAIGSLLDSNGDPLSASHVGVYGHTVLE